MARRYFSFSFLVLIILVAIAVIILRRAPAIGKTPIEPLQPYRAETRSEYSRRNRSRHRRETSAACAAFAVPCDSVYFGSWQTPDDGSCSTTVRRGYPVPDPHCTPGGIDPEVTVDVLRNPAWRTGCVRNCETSEAKKHVAYRWYGMPTPRRNHGDLQVCEPDHLVPLELGGADGLGNIWPECGPPGVALEDRHFKVKDRVENYLADEVKSGKMSLEAAQRGIAFDWTQYLGAANRYCAAGGRCG